MILRGIYTYRRQKRWREKLKKVTVLLHFELLKQLFQRLIELLNIIMYEEEKWKRSGIEYDSGEHGQAKLEHESW